MGKIKVVHIITRFDKGGSAENTFLTISGLNREKYSVTFIKGLSEESEMSAAENCMVQDELAMLEENNIKIINLPPLVRRIAPLKDLKALFKLILILRKEKPDIVHTHTSKAGLLGRIAAFLTGTPIIIHTPHGHIFHSYFGPALTKVFILIEKIASRITDRIITLTDRERDEHIEKGIAPVERFITIHSGVTLNRFKDLAVHREKKKEELGIPKNGSVIGTVGRLVPVKGQKYLVAALERLIKEFPETVLVIVGDGHLRPELEKQAEEAGIRKNIIFTGWRREVPEILSLFDILVFPSLNEGMGKVLVEGMALEKPIVASNAGGIRDLIEDGRNGILVPPKNPEVLANAISKLMKNRALAENLGKNGRDRVYPDFDASTMVAKIEGLYESLLGKVSREEIKNIT